MKGTSLLRRITGATYLTLALALSGAMPVAEARAVAATADAVAHVEAPDASGSCAAVHDHWTCASCRALRLKPRAEEHVLVGVISERRADLPSESRQRASDLTTRSSTHSRAPPPVLR